MTDIAITNLTNKTVTEDGTGIFDIIAASVKLHLKDEWDAGRVTGTEYATVYLGTLQTTLQQSLAFLLTEQEASLKVELLEKQVEQAKEQIDLITAQTAQAHEAVAASQAKTRRENILNNKQVLLVEAQIAEQKYITANIRPQDLLKLEGEVSFIAAREAEVLASTVRSDAESAQKVLLMAAQTLGFASDTKQKILKQMNDGFAVVLSVAGQGNVPEANQDAAIDDLTQELLSNVGSSVIIATAETPPPLPDA